MAILDISIAQSWRNPLPQEIERTVNMSRCCVSYEYLRRIGKFDTHGIRKLFISLDSNEKCAHGKRTSKSVYWVQLQRDVNSYILLSDEEKIQDTVSVLRESGICFAANIGIDATPFCRTADLMANSFIDFYYTMRTRTYSDIILKICMDFRFDRIDYYCEKHREGNLDYKIILFSSPPHHMFIERALKKIRIKNKKIIQIADKDTVRTIEI